MKHYSPAVLVLILIVVGTVMSESAMARGGRGGGHGGGHGYGGRIGVGIALGVPLYGLGYYSAPYYSYPYAYPSYSYPAPVVAPAPYVQQGYAQAAPAPAPQQDWYYCLDSKSYYPYVRECPSGWQRVPSQPQR